MSYANAHRDDVAAILGEIDPAIVDYIVDTGATLGEVAQAVAALEAEHDNDTRPPLALPPRIAEVRSVLAPLFAGTSTKGITLC